MANMNLVTGYWGEEHVTSNDQGSFNAAMFGNGEFVLERGNQFAASIQSNNKVRVLDGDMLMQGRHIRLKENTYVDLNFDNGTQGYKRLDLIVVRYSKSSTTDVEEANLVVIKGTPSETSYNAPEKITGDILTEGALENDTVLYRVKFDGLNIQPLEKVFETVSSPETLQRKMFLQIKNILGDAVEDAKKRISEAIGELITLTVTADDADLIGDSIKVTKGDTILEQTFGASKALTFHLPELGKWKVTSTNPDHSGSSEITCEMYGRYSVTLSGDFNWKKWVKVGGLSADGYASFTDVLADEKAIRQLMTKHASADALADAMIKNRAGFRAKITASKNAMKWIGLRDYICDKLLADAETQSDLLASDHWRYILKDGVPYMTSSTSPYGEVETTASAMAPYYAYKVFYAPQDETTPMNTRKETSWAAPVGEHRIGYRFTNPICVKRVDVTSRVEGSGYNRCIKDFVVVASNDGKTWDELGRFTGKNYEGTEAHTDHFDLKNDKYYMHYALWTLSSHDATYVGIGRMNFYGRSLNTAVPTMASDTAPWGKIIYSSQWDGGSSAGRQAFSGTDSSWYPSPSDSSGKAYIGYVYPTPTRVRQVTFICHNGNQSEVCVVERSDDGERWEKASDEIRITVDNETKILNVDASPARYWRIRNVSGNIYVANHSGFNLRKVQFYGVDYSERDDRTYIYDHGMELTPLNVKIADGTIPLNPPEKKETYIQLTAPSGKSCGVGVAIDVTNLKRLRAVTDQGTINVGAEFGRFFATTEGNAQAYIAYASASAPPYNHSLDLTSITGVKTLVHLVWSGLSTGLSEMWLE